jgi:hypothetical protein
MLNHAFAHFLNKRRRFDSPFLTSFVPVGVVWRRSFIPAIVNREEGGSFSSPLFLFICFFFITMFLPPLLPPLAIKN